MSQHILQVILHRFTTTNAVKYVMTYNSSFLFFSSSSFSFFWFLKRYILIFWSLYNPLWILWTFLVYPWTVCLSLSDVCQNSPLWIFIVVFFLDFVPWTFAFPSFKMFPSFYCCSFFFGLILIAIRIINLFHCCCCCFCCSYV